MTTLTAPARTEYITADERRCSTCGTPMERHGLAWVCPRQRDEERSTSDDRRASVLATLAARVDDCEF